MIKLVFLKLGHGTGKSTGEKYKEKIPRILDCFEKSEITQIYAGANCSFAVSKSGNVFSWGEVNINFY